MRIDQKNSQRRNNNKKDNKYKLIDIGMPSMINLFNGLQPPRAWNNTNRNSYALRVIKLLLDEVGRCEASQSRQNDCHDQISKHFIMEFLLAKQATHLMTKKSYHGPTEKYVKRQASCTERYKRTIKWNGTATPLTSRNDISIMRINYGTRFRNGKNYKW